MPPRKRKEKVAAEGAITSEPGSMKLAELRQELEKRGLDSGGRKAELVSRLEAALSSTGPSPTKKTKSDEEEEGGLDFDKMKVAELQDELAKRGLSTSGRKSELVSRLKAAAASSQTPGQSGSGEMEEETMALEEETDFSKAVKALKEVEKEESKAKGSTTRTPKVDTHVPMAGCYAVVGDWDCMLNQTNIGQNNNKYYVIQLLQRTGSGGGGGGFSVWTRWGRVGEPGQHALKRFGSMDAASHEFCKKFRDKTRNAWEERGNFRAVPGKYTLIEMDADDELEEVSTCLISLTPYPLFSPHPLTSSLPSFLPQEVASKLAALEETDAPARHPVKACSLDKPTQELLNLIFDNDMFQDAMRSMEIGELGEHVTVT